MTSSHGACATASLRSSITSLRIFSLADIDKRCQMCQSKGLCPPYWLLATCAMIWVAMLQAVEEAVRLLDHCLADDGTVLQHILQIDQIAVMHHAVHNNPNHGNG